MQVVAAYLTPECLQANIHAYPYLTGLLYLMQVAPVPVSVFAQQISQLSLDAEPPPFSHLPRFTHFLCVPPLLQSPVL
jgi:hypothetical protein